MTVEISDTGPGVPADEQEVIFDEFRQSERTAARGYGGLGVGLAICRQLVELHGGQIGVRSAGVEEGGSTFYFTLPAMSDPSPAAPAGMPDSSVLMIAENSGGGTPLLDFLSREGFQVRALYMDETPDWQAKLACLSPGAIVLDCEPASPRGWRVVETLKDNPATAEIPVLYYTLSPQDAGSMLAVDYVSKPLGGSSLAQVLYKHGLASGKSDDSTVILVVDDDPDILDMHVRMVRASLPECRVLQASNGRAAMEIMAGQVPSVVLLDLMMPELDGMGVLAAMQESERLRGVPVIILTAQALTQKEMAQLNRGVAAILGKGLFTTHETMAHIENTLARNKRLGSETQRMVRKVMSYIHEHYAEPVSREDVASVVGVSARHLTRFFHQEVGVSPITYLNRYRVRQAKQLLEAGDKNVSEVAAAVGFSTSSHFTDAFRREVGVSPRDYQRGKRKA